HNAWLRTIEDGIHTYDIYHDGISKQKVGTHEFSDAVIARMGMAPQQLKAVNYTTAPQHASYQPVMIEHPAEQKTLVGVDVFLDWHSGSAAHLGDTFKQVSSNGLELTMITNRGAKVWPDGMPETFCTDHWRCRFMARDKGAITHSQITKLLTRIDEAGFDFIKIENLYNFDGKPSYSAGQGE
ncbi:MAG TPA: NADP-dependent isocitrate dehydrogenase, partial [Ktedonobacteraceae bacterium]|nr:NADP-dependent isocitrate dehydrogenase [Ktedonobacteraceae bacterium]